MLSTRPFYATPLEPCPYLEDRQEQRVVTILERTGDDAVFDRLVQAGFRRSQNYLYRPACPACRACIPVRIVVGEFAHTRRWRKVLKRNADLLDAVRPAQATEEQFALFKRYVGDRHNAGGMASMGWQQFRDMIEEGPASAFVLELRDGSGRLVAASLADRLQSGLSGVYKFFDPGLAGRSLGSCVILRLVARAAEEALPYVYLGYWIGGCRKMAYKKDFRPLEELAPEGWRRIDDGA